jgi:hypothetical protein
MEGVLFQNLYLGDEAKGDQILDLVRPLLVESEEIRLATKGMRDGAVFTSKRIVVVNRQGITGKKIEFTTIPLRSISAFTIENSGTFDLDAELTLYGTGFGKAKMQFSRGFDIKKLAACLASTL